MDAHSFKEIVSGHEQGLAAGLARAALAAAEGPYRWAVSARNYRYDTRPTLTQRVDVPVISVGNITTGGTGKTPMVAWIARRLRDRGKRVVLVSRGYGAKSGSPNDEAMELALRLPDVPHVQNPDRVAAAQQAIQGHQAEVVVLDDAFQHRRIHRDLDIVLIDALEPFGYGRLLPRGLLREPLASLQRADLVILSRADLISSKKREEIAKTVKEHAPDSGWAEVAHRPHELITMEATNGNPRSEPIANLRNNSIAAFCGIGNPAAFRKTLENSGTIVSAFREFPDHHAFPPNDIASLGMWLDTHNVHCAVCTTKDFVKLRLATLGRHPLYALSIDVEFLVGGDHVESQLTSLIEKRASSSFE